MDTARVRDMLDFITYATLLNNKYTEIYAQHIGNNTQSIQQHQQQQQKCTYRTSFVSAYNNNEVDFFRKIKKSQQTNAIAPQFAYIQ